MRLREARNDCPACKTSNSMKIVLVDKKAKVVERLKDSERSAWNCEQCGAIRPHEFDPS